MKIDLKHIDGFEWDEGNLTKSYLKHNVSNAEAEQAFFNRPAKFMYDIQHSQDEHRFVLFGLTNEKRMLLIIFTLRQNKIRVISARDQNRKERNFFVK